MTTKQQTVVQQGSRWLRVGTLTLTTLGPIINILMDRMRQQMEAKRLEAINEQRAQLIADAEVEEDETDETDDTEDNSFSQRLADFSLMSRQLVADQARQLQKQGQSWQAQAKQLRKALRRESKQRRRLQKMVKQLRKAGIELGQEIVDRGEGLTEDLVGRGSKVAHDLTERGSELGHDLVKQGSKLTQNLAERGSDLVERGSELGQGLVKRGSDLTQDLVKRGSDVTQDLVERGGNLLQPARKRRSTFWTVFGFTVGLVVAAVVTYLFVRKRMAQQVPEQDQQFELPPRDSNWHFTDVGKPSGEIRHLGNDGSSVATLSTVGIQKHAPEEVKAPADAAFAGVVGTKVYYPIDEVPSDAKDVIYFATVEEAQAEGYSAAVATK